MEAKSEQLVEVDSMIGRKFGRWTVERELLGDRRPGQWPSKYYCLCECGNPKLAIIRKKDLIRGKTKSCGCLRAEIYSGKFRHDLTGQVFGRLGVVEYAGIKRDKNGANAGSLWWCQCSCGKRVKVEASNLKAGNSKSCGCLAIEQFIARTKKYPDRIIGQKYSTYKTNAASRSLYFGLTYEVAKFLFESPCHYCLKSADENLNGIDRVDSRLGYTVDNAVSCCSVCNWMKSDMQCDDFLAHIKRIADCQGWIS